MLSWILLAAASGVPAAPVEPEATLAWEAPPSCPDVTDIRAAVVQLAGRWPQDSEFEARGEVTGAAERWSLELWTRVDTHVHQQQLEARTCAGLADAAALIIAVSIDPIASAASVELVDTAPAVSPVEAPAIPEPEPEPTAPEPPVPASDKPIADPQVQMLLGLGAGLGAGFSPGTSGGPSLSLGVAGKHARFVLEGRYWAPTRAEGASGAAADTQAGFVAALGCWTSGHLNVEAVVCGGAETGALRARGDRVAGASTQHYPRLAGLARMGVAWHLRPNIALTAGLDVAASALDAVVVVGAVDSQTSEIVYRTPRVGARGIVGVEFSIPFRKR